MSDEPMTATRAMRIDYAAMRERRDRDNMFRQIADAAAHAAMTDARNQIDPDDIRMKDVAGVALAAASQALKIAFERDAALSVAIAERDQYKKMALQVISFTPPAPITLGDLP